MNRILILPFFIFLTFNLVGQENAEVTKVYDALSSKDIEQLDNAIILVKSYDTKDAQAYYGALLMKKAGLINGLGKKLSTFKEGKNHLEGSIDADSSNPEYRFLRLMIQENAPAILGYKENIEEDISLIQSNFSNLNNILKDAIRQYSLVSDKIAVE